MQFEQAIPEHIQTWLPTRQRGLSHLLKDMSDVIMLGYGDVGFISPRHTLEAAKDAIDAGHTQYTYLRVLREAIADKLSRDNGIEANPDTEIIVSCGCHAVLFQIFATFIEPGDQVIMGTPGSYYYGNTLFQGGIPVEVALRESRGFRIDPDEIAAAITPRTKIIALTTPEAPAGAVQFQEDLERVAHLAQEHDLLVISDEIYEKINYGRVPHFSIGSLPGMHERTITVNGFSKGYSMTGWRVGYAVVPHQLMPAVQAVNGVNTIWLNSIAQYAALAAYRGPQEPMLEMVAEYQRRMAILVDELNKIEGIHCLHPDGTYYAWPNVSSFGLSSHNFVTHLLLTEKVYAQPGTTFGRGGEGYMRVSCSEPEDEMREGLRRLGLAVERLRTDGPVLSG